MSVGFVPSANIGANPTDDGTLHVAYRKALNGVDGVHRLHAPISWWRPLCGFLWPTVGGAAILSTPGRRPVNTARIADLARRPPGFVIRLPVAGARAWDLSDKLP
jgi:hypothetical protein